MKTASGKNIFFNERVGMITLGCARNAVDSEAVLSRVRSGGGRVCRVGQATTVLVNTCAFTTEAKEESIGTILDLIELKKKGKIKKIYVYGCLAQRYRGELKKNFKEVDGFDGIAGFKTVFDRSFPQTAPHTAYVKLCEGCANLCSYCAIPLIKGPLVSRDEGSVLKEIRTLEAAGVQEVNLVGQDITLFGHQGRRRIQKELPLTALLKNVLKKTRIPWIRLLYLHPRRLSDDLLDVMASEQRICAYLDVPLQHSEDRILKLMNRGVDRRTIVALLGRVRRRVPGVALRTSFIVGFPSETEQEFRGLLDFVKDMRFDRLGAFKYSREEGTRAYSFPGQCTEAVKERRYNALMSLQKDVSKEMLQKKIGTTLRVLVDKKGTGGSGAYVGRSEADAPEVDGVVFVTSSRDLKPGSFVRARVVDALEYDLFAVEEKRGR